jgi:tetratricopeptide (TPR) repeat protein
MMRVLLLMNQTLCGFLTAVAIAASAVTVSVAPTAAASLSEQLSQKIAEARRAEFARDYDGALAVYQAAMKMDQSTPAAVRAVLKHRADLFETLKLFSNAETDLTQASRVMPKDATAYGDRGYFYMRRGRFRDALDDFVTGSRLDPQNPMYMYAAARSLVAMDDYAGAVAFYTEAIKNGPRQARHYLARAEAYVRLKQWPEALADYDRAEQLGLTSRADNYFVHAGRGYVALVSRDYPLAIAQLDRALAIDPDAVNVLMWRGYAHERRGQLEAALRDYERAAKFQPDSVSVRDSNERMRIAVRELPVKQEPRLLRRQN